MSHCAVFYVSTEEDMSFELDFGGTLDLTGKSLSMAIRERGSGNVRTTLTVGSGLTLVGPGILAARVARSAMSAWPRGEYTADLIDLTGARAERIIPVVVIYNDPGRMGCTGGGRQAVVSWSPRQAVVTAYRGMQGDRGPPGPGNVLSVSVTTLPPGSQATSSISGASPSQALALGIPAGMPGAGAPTSPDILAATRFAARCAQWASVGISEMPLVYADWVDGIFWASGRYIGSSLADFLAATGGNPFARSSTATYWGADGLMYTAAVNEPRIEHDPVTRQPLGLLREAAGQNLSTRSEELEVWSGVGLTVTTGPEVSPRGDMTSRALVEAVETGEHCVLAPAANVVSGSQYAFSCFVRARGRSAVRLSLETATGPIVAVYVVADLTAGTIASRAATPGGEVLRGEMTHVGNGWWRVWVSGSVPGAAQLRGAIRLLDGAGSEAYQGDGVSGVEAWGAQLEAGSAPTSYIPTTTSVAARVGDSLLRVPLPPPVAVEKGTVFAEAIRSEMAAELLDLRAASAANRYLLARGDDGRPLVRWIRNNSTAATATGATSMVNPARVALAYAEGNSRCAFSTGEARDVPSGVIIPDVSHMTLPGNGLGMSSSRIAYWSRRLPDAQLASLVDLSKWS